MKDFLKILIISDNEHILRDSETVEEYETLRRDLTNELAQKAINDSKRKELNFFHRKDFRPIGEVVEEDGEKWEVESHELRSIEILKQL